MKHDKKCPNCKSNNVIPIIYGRPDRELSKAVQSKRAIMGGCVWGPDSSLWACQKCNYRFNSSEDTWKDITRIEREI